MPSMADFKQYDQNQLYGKGNINLFDRPIVYRDEYGNIMPDNNYSTVYSKTFSPENTGQNYWLLVPGVRHGLDRQMTDQEAFDWYAKTGEYLGKFNSNEEADAYAEQLHNNQAKYYDQLANKSYTKNEVQSMPQQEVKQKLDQVLKSQMNW